MLKNKDFFAFKLSEVVFIVLMNVKMTTIVDILTFVSLIDVIWVGHENSFIASGPDLIFFQQLQSIVPCSESKMAS